MELFMGLISRLFITIIIACGGFQSFSQSHYVDSLENLLRTPIPDTVKVWALNELSREQIYGSPEKSTSLANEALALASSIGYKRGEAYSYRILASISGTNDRYLSYSEYLEKAIRLFIDLQDSVGLGNCYITEAIVYDRQRNFESSISSYLKAIPIFRNARMPERVAVCLNNLGFVYYQMDRYEEARESLAEAIAINESINNTTVLINSYSNFGLVLTKLGDLSEAESYFEKVLQLHKELKDNSNPEAFVETLIGKSQIYNARNQFDEEKKILDEAKKYAEEFHYMDLRKQTYLRLTQYYLRTRNFEKSNEMLGALAVIDDSITRQQRRNEAAIIASVINSAKLESDFENAQDNIEKQELVIAQQEKTLIAVALVGALFFVLLILLILSNRSRRRMNRTLATHREAIDNKNIELERLNQTKDKFFSVVAHDLRSPLNSLYGFSNLLVNHSQSMSKDEIQKMGSQLRESVANTLKMTENLITWARSQMHEEQTNPELIDVRTVIDETFKISAEEAAKKGVTLQRDNDESANVYADRNHLLLTLRNIINNSIKYTQAGDRISITAVEQNGHTKITIEDTGIGMDDETKEKLFSLEGTVSQLGTSGERGTGLGLVLVKIFLERNGGSLSVSSEKNKGSKFIVELPSAQP
ncbi:MAG: tetratricopeptide repeat-containing sensor histidine kinase [Cyclobacteriaceae bacterium]